MLANIIAGSRKYPLQVAPLGQQILEAISIEHLHEGGERLVQGTGQTASGRNDAAGAIDEIETVFGVTDDLANIDVSRKTREPHPTIASEHALQLARVPTLIAYLPEVILRDAIGARDLGYG